MSPFSVFSSIDTNTLPDIPLSQKIKLGILFIIIPNFAGVVKYLFQSIFDYTTKTKKGGPAAGPLDPEYNPGQLSDKLHLNKYGTAGSSENF